MRPRSPASPRIQSSFRDHQSLQTLKTTKASSWVEIVDSALWLWVVAVNSVDYVHANIPEGWLWMIVKIISDIALFLMAIVGVFVTWLLLQVILCTFFYEKFARQVELLLGINPDELQDVPILDQISTVVRDAINLVIVNVGLLVLHLVPVIGSVAAMCGSFYFIFLILGSEFFVYPLDLRGRLRVEKRQYVKQHRYHTLGLGAAVMSFASRNGPRVETNAEQRFSKSSARRSSTIRFRPN